MTSDYRLGFSTLEQETVIHHLPVSGHMPTWLAGTLVRNGPAKFEVGAQSYRHWFDGLAMLHSFTFQDGAVAYANKFIESRDYREAKEQGRITLSSFATDPCRSVFQRVLSMFSPPAITENGNVNISRLADRYIAMTEVPLPIEFDPKTLKTVGVFDYGKDQLVGHATTAHPHFDFTRAAAINYLIEFSRTSTYKVYHVPPGQVQRHIIGMVGVPEPAYMHSFGMTENYVILAEFPLVVNPLKLMFSGKPFITNYVWKPERGTRFILMNKRDGATRMVTADAFFCFHHVNAYEDNGEVVVDLAAYPDPGIIDAFYLNNLRTGQTVPLAELRRYRLPAQGQTATFERLSGESIELPRLNYKQVNGQTYQFTYGVSNRKDRPGEFNNQLVKVDVRARQDKVWFADGCYPGEPVFIPTPGGQAEDDGVILSVVLEAARGTSFLLVLDARDFSEIARAQVPHHIPFGFHGQYFA